VNLTPLSGLRAADLLMSRTADQVARAGLPGADPDPGVELGEQMVNLSVAHAVYTANARVLAASLENERTLLDVLA
jgi:hypothetical protein